MTIQNSPIDYHCHLLPGFDDGPARLDESLKMARLLADAGFRTVCCTPHFIRGSYDAPAAEVRRAVASLQAELNSAGIDLQLQPGREYYLDEFLLQTVAADPLPLGDSNLLLVELPFYIAADQVKDVCYRLTGSGYRVMIAHPERSPLLQMPPVNGKKKGFWGALFNSKPAIQDPGFPANTLLAYLQDIGCAFQGNLGSFAGGYGPHVRDNALRLRQAGVYSHYGSDGHNAKQLRLVLHGAQNFLKSD